jgi:hypothetical protein
MSVSDDTSSAASIAAAINDSKEDGQEQVSDIHDTTNDINDNVSDDDVSNDKDKETDADVFFLAAREIMNWSNKKNRHGHHEGLPILQLLWSVELDCPQDVGHAGGGWPAPQELQAQASALGSLFFEGVSQGGPRMLCCWWV